ncbi:hypothetical protein C2845_PM06G05470 [Panicum miliaceum]|uniref:Uncharacterized protein n=1 Tax=Panicum miliaceum TaxID=4540 RepID=A0A3L6R6L8_PANMI|nr:hypothetical protein C2845_PM06G05470 [Panicum miliaceum]
MAGGGSRRAGAAEEPRIGSGNVFAALETLKKKKKPAADKGAKPAAREEERKPEFVVMPYACFLMIQSFRNDMMNAAAPPAAPKDTERQLSKKELKKKELAELDAVLAELGLGTPTNSTQDESNGKKGADQATDGEKKEDAPAPPESKSSKKKKSKKDKSSKESKEAQDQGNGSEEPDEDTASVDVKERIKKVASMKKKKSSKEMDAAAKIAASEAAARSARLAAAKKKEKSHYNQQPLR